MDVLRCIAYLKDIVMNYLAVGARHPTPPPKRVLNGSERIGRPVLRSARSGKGGREGESGVREFASEEKLRPPLHGPHGGGGAGSFELSRDNPL